MMFYLLYFGPVLVLTACFFGLVMFVGSFTTKRFQGASNKKAFGFAARLTLTWTLIGSMIGLGLLIILAVGAGA